MAKNAYFQVIINDGGTFVKVFKETEGGNPVKLDEIKEYLEKNQILNSDLRELNTAMLSGKPEVMAKVSSAKGYPINEIMKITVSEDSMTASVRFYPPSDAGKRMSLEEMKGDLNYNNIKYGVDETVLMRQVADPEYCTDVVVATGKPVVEGKNAFITYNFKTEKKLKPKRNEDGSVDFHNLDNINHVNKGDVLAVLTPADRGVDGISVFGGVVKPRSVENKVLKFGRNIKLSDDKLSITTEVDGHVTLEGDKVFVSDTYDVPADVDNSTGDITYEGNVIVHGNVRTGFKVRASGNIEVFGVVEGAEVVAGGQIIIHHGIQGMSKGIVVAKGNLISKFIESARVQVEGFIESEAIIQSQVSARGDIVVKGVKGNIIGGHVRSTSLVDAKTIGSPMGITTLVEAGVDPALQDKLAKTKAEMTEKTADYKKYLQVADVMKKRFEKGLLDDEKKKGYKATLEKIQELKQQLFDLQAVYEEITAQMNENNKAMIKCSRVIYPGTRVSIAGETLIVNEEVSHTQYMKLSGEVKASPML